MFGVWGRQEVGRRLSIFSCHPYLLSILLPLFAFHLSSLLRLSFQEKKRESTGEQSCSIFSSFYLPTRLIPLTSELSRFIAAGRLHASIDKVHGIVETTHPSLKNAQYKPVVKQGDVLLNEVQRLSKVLY